MREDLVSVIVPVYNIEEYLPRCIDSILRQTYLNIEIILVDDGSTDTGGLICDNYAQNDTRINVIHKENGGLSDARNAGIINSHGEYLMFIDGDDYVEITLECCQKYNVLVSVCGMNRIKNGVTIPCVSKKQEVINSVEAISRMALHNGSEFSACAAIYSKSLWEKYRFPVGRIAEDASIMYKVIDDAGRICMINKTLYNYCVRDNSIITSKFSEKNFDYLIMAEEMLEYIDKVHPEIHEIAFLKKMKVWFDIVYRLDNDKDAKKKYYSKYKELRHQLTKNIKFWIFNAKIPKMERIKYTLMYFHLYKALYSIYFRAKGFLQKKKI